jgi:hypothetical protein
VRVHNEETTYRQRNRKKAREQEREWAKKNPEKVRAHQMVRAAIKAGSMKRATLCEKCCSSGRIEAHHPDYAKPLSVLWLCRKCHSAAHGGFLGRSIGGARGEKHGSAKLTARDVLAIRKLLKSGMSQGEIGKVFGVTNSLVHLVKAGKIWKHV